jgi:4-hydroxy 2-oxovalerate aldolase
MSIRQTRLFQDPQSVLDATLRDAGYLNAWSFSREQIFAVVTAVAQAGVEATEVGYISDNPQAPLAARSDARLLTELREQTAGRINLAAMISLNETDPESLFASRRDVLDLIRIPSTIAQIPQALQIATAAQQAGIACSLNLVNISVLTDQQIVETVEKVQQAGVVDIFYLADSRGACRPDDVSHIVGLVRTHWPGLLGFHAHDNTGFANVNPLLALEAGCELIDGTVHGLGLGSGNTKLPYAMALVQQRQSTKPYQYAALEALNTFDVRVSAEKSYLYYLVGAKNLAQLWVEPLLERYGADTARRLQQIPTRPYTAIEQVIQEIEACKPK